MLLCYQCQIFKTIIYSVGHETIYFEKYLRTAASENLSDAAILIFRRYFRSSSLSAFCKVSVLKTSVKFLGKHICWSLFSINLQALIRWILLDEKLHHGYFSMKKFYRKNTFLTAEVVVRRCSKKEGVLRNHRVFLNKKKTFWHMCFPVNFAKFLTIPFFTEHLRWLIL